jgi:hypothetical protein
VPDGLVATALSSATIALVWNDNSDNETGFEVQMAQDAFGAPDEANAVTVGVTPSGSESYVISGLTAVTQYWFRVRATGVSGYSPWTVWVSMTTLAGGGGSDEEGRGRMWERRRGRRR